MRPSPIESNLAESQPSLLIPRLRGLPARALLGAAGDRFRFGETRSTTRYYVDSSWSLRRMERARRNRSRLGRGVFARDWGHGS